MNTSTENVICEICPRRCALQNGQFGFCGVRQNLNGTVVCAVYGCTTGLAVDPVEKKPLMHFYPGSRVLSFGTVGCNLACHFCQNWTISQSRDIKRCHIHISPEQIAQIAVKYGCKSVAYTYNDPVIWMEYATDTARACHDVGIKNIAVTAGYIQPEARKLFFTHMDAVNVDLKSIQPQFYEVLCHAQLGPVLDTLLYLRNETDSWLEITNLLIPSVKESLKPYKQNPVVSQQDGLQLNLVDSSDDTQTPPPHTLLLNEKNMPSCGNDSDDNITRLCEWTVNHLGPDVPIHFSAFHPAYRIQNRPPTSAPSLIRACQIGIKSGLHYVYSGNISTEYETTYCPECHHPVIHRNGYFITHIALKPGGNCSFCGNKIAGHFQGE